MKRSSMIFVLGLHVAGLTGCDGDASPDGGRREVDGGIERDAAPLDDGGTHADGAALDSDAGHPGDAGPSACGEGLRDPGGVAMSCRTLECFDDDTCVQQQLAAQGHAGYTRCGAPLPIDPTSSASACMEEPPFGGIPGPERRCGPTSFSGTIVFYCSPDTRRVVARWRGRMDSSSGAAEYYLGHYYWAGSGGGSGDAYNMTWSAGVPGSEHFVGFQAVTLPSGASRARLQVWFMSGDLFSPMSITGGFSADVPPT